ncbi:MAG TPA: LysR substrate-binding domain-containing protein [Novimethylophilus sp.]|jgi:DNA-binding transcriptional LysR family regulator|uniref:LysR family transcriptional regulator n=1 Tax=Novimethylophilus sp. TaxID=2137426 RepID=UPI002F40A286
MMRHATFRQLEVFEAIARLGSFTRASEELHLTQPTVSMQMKKLSDAVGLPIYEQIGRQIRLTDAGQELATTAREILQALEHYDMVVADMQGLKKGKLRLTVSTTAKYFAPRMLGEFSRIHPGIEVSLKVTNRQKVLDRAAENLDDLYILCQPVSHVALDARPFLENALVVLAHPEHPLVGVRNIPIARLEEEPFLMREIGSGTRLSVEQMFASHGIKPNIRMELGSNEAIKQAILGRLGISVLSRHTLGMDGMNELVVLDVEGFPIVRQWHIAYPRGKQLSVVAKAFLEFLWENVMPDAEPRAQGRSSRDR